MEGTKPVGIAMEDSLLKSIDSAIERTDFKSRSEFITEAVMYYLSALNVKDLSKVLSPAVESSVRAASHQVENNISGMLYKIAIELDILMHVTAATNEIDDTTLRKLRAMCVQEVNASCGKISFENAYKLQKG